MPITGPVPRPAPPGVRPPDGPGAGPGNSTTAMTKGRPAISRKHFGTLADGTKVDIWTVSNGPVVMKVLSYGGIVQTLEVPDRDGRRTNIALGHDTLEGYLTGTAFFGALIGRYGNRIANGRFELDNVVYQLPPNDGTSTLHGGPDGFDKRIWDIAPFTRGDDTGLTLRYVSADGEMGFPGRLTTRVDYTHTPDGHWRIDYQAVTTKPTVVNLTQHTYFNLGGESSGSVHEHELTLAAARYTPVDARLIPTGELAPVAGTPFDFRYGKTLGADIRDGSSRQLLYAKGIDHNFALDKGVTAAPEPVARFTDHSSGRMMTVATTEPGVQLYSGNFLDGTAVGTGGSVYRQGDGFAFETQHFPDSPNQPSFPPTVLRPGQIHRTSTVHGFSTC
jgi:aldose 1-epimerase